jgi:hypothetical protein
VHIKFNVVCDPIWYQILPLKAVCMTQTFTYTCWLICDFSNKCEEIRLDDRPTFFLIWPYFYYDISYNAKSHKNILQQNWLYLKIVCLNMHIRKFLLEFMTTLLAWSVFSIVIIQKKVTFKWYSHCNWQPAPWLQMSQSLKGASLRQPSTMQ